MFQIEDEITYRWPVKVSRPSKDKPGEFDEFTFTAHFLAMPREKAEAYTKELTADLSRPATEQKLDSDELLLRVLVGWDEVNDMDGKPLPFSEEARAKMLRFAWNRLGLYAAWRASNNPEARAAGN